ncbi:hypothetical protein PG988_006761 [Apiospora saccharicola]
MEGVSRVIRLDIEYVSELVKHVESLAMSYPDLRNDNFSDIKSSLKAVTDRHDILLERLTKRMDYLEGRIYLLDDWDDFCSNNDILSGVRTQALKMATQNGGAQAMHPYPHPVLRTMLTDALLAQLAREPAFPSPGHLGHYERLSAESVVQQQRLVREMAHSTYRRVVAVEPDVSRITAVGEDFCRAKRQLNNIRRHPGWHFDREVDFMAIHGRHLVIRAWIDEYIVNNKIEDKLPVYVRDPLKVEPEKKNDAWLAFVVAASALVPALVLATIFRM